jgi:hypothetical protein
MRQANALNDTSSTTRSSQRRLSSGCLVATFAASIIASSVALSGCASTKTNYDDRTFFRDEQGLETHGRKTWFDHLVELDPGALKTHLAAD